MSIIEKIKVTQAQADAIEGLSHVVSRDNIMNHHREIRSNNGASWFRLKELSAADLARALYIGYEVEEEYKVGDWVAFIKLSGDHIISKVKSVSAEEVMTDHVSSNGYKQKFYKETIRHASPEEIKEELERRAWESISRKVNDWKYGDCYRMSGRQEDVYLVDCEDSEIMAKERYKRGIILGIYPVESFFEFGDESDGK